ncbi:hypothetical protein EDF57_11429 [Novosphingobium sp. PhB55]|nr:hypothetical protein EDF57_11429 [Novosphingobium sp. PhB55]
MFETGPQAVSFYHALTPEGLPAICIDARHAKAASDIATNKTHANDADELAHLAEVGFHREARVKSFDSMLIRTLIAAHSQLLKVATQLSNQVYGLMKTFSLVAPKGADVCSRAMCVACWRAMPATPVRIVDTSTWPTILP